MFSSRITTIKHPLIELCFDTAENEPCKVCPLSVYRSPRFRPISLDLAKAGAAGTPNSTQLPEESSIRFQPSPQVLEQILERCAGCATKLDAAGQTALHYAAKVPPRFSVAS